MSNKVTGDITNFTAVEKKGVTLHNFPNYPKAVVDKKENIINISAQSGKRLGSQVLLTFDGDGTPANAYKGIYTALGSAPTDEWALVAQVEGIAEKAPKTITPA